jgi:hypothetical protein
MSTTINVFDVKKEMFEKLKSIAIPHDQAKDEDMLYTIRDHVVTRDNSVTIRTNETEVNYFYFKGDEDEC